MQFSVLYALFFEESIIFYTYIYTLFYLLQYTSSNAGKLIVHSIHLPGSEYTDDSFVNGTITL